MHNLQVTPAAIFTNNYQITVCAESKQNAPLWDVHNVHGKRLYTYAGTICQLLKGLVDREKQGFKAQKGAVKIKKVISTGSSLLVHQNRLELKQYFDKSGREYWLTEKDGIFHNIQQGDIFRILFLTFNHIKAL
jgi:hypothetical protein